MLLKASVPKTCQLWSTVGVQAYSLGMLCGIRLSCYHDNSWHGLCRRASATDQSGQYETRSSKFYKCPSDAVSSFVLLPVHQKKRLLFDVTQDRCEIVCVWIVAVGKLSLIKSCAIFADEVVTTHGPIEADKENIRQEPYSLPQGFMWDTLDLSNADVVSTVLTQ